MACFFRLARKRARHAVSPPSREGDNFNRVEHVERVDGVGRDSRDGARPSQLGGRTKDIAMRETLILFLLSFVLLSRNFRLRWAGECGILFPSCLQRA